jgi:uncharacterized membrane protein/phage shock protein PspC (stress-responsive transcriptional regulator)
MDAMPEKRTAKRTVLWVGIVLAVLILAGLTGWLLLTPPGFFGKLDAVGYSVCHQLPDHSLEFYGRQMPLCARCTGMYIGALVGLCFLLPGRRRARLPARKLYLPIGITFLLYLVDGVNSYLNFDPGGFHLYTAQNWLRLLTGTGVGLAIPLFLVPVFNLVAWKDTVPEPSVARFRDYFLMLGIALLLDLSVLAGIAWVRLAFSVLTILTLAGILVLVYTSLWIMLIRREANLASFRQLWPWLLAGLGSALLQVGLLDLLRYALTGTWLSFPI